MQSKKKILLFFILIIEVIAVAVLLSEKREKSPDVSQMKGTQESVQESMEKNIAVENSEVKEEQVAGAIDIAGLTSIEGFTEKQSIRIREKLQNRILYKKPSNYAILEIWLDDTDVENGELLGTLFYKKDMELVGVDSVSNINALQMDGNTWLAVTVKMLFAGEEGIFTYDDSVLSLMVPVIANGSDCELGNIHVQADLTSVKEPLAYYEELGFSAITCNVISADVTHDGIEDKIVTVIYNEPEKLSQDVHDILNNAGVGFVQVFDGSIEESETESLTGIVEANKNLIWQKEFAYARVGNTQVSIVSRNGLDYLLVSDINEQQGCFAYSYQVLALDADGHEYVIESENCSFETTEQSGIPNGEQKQQIIDFKQKMDKWFVEATLVAATDINAQRHYVSTAEEIFTPADYYDNVWNRY